MINEKYAKILWRAMHQRCNPASKIYQGASVSLEWATFPPFYEWAKEHYVEGYQLDKDLIQLGNKLYAPHMCAFVPSYINKLLTSSSATRGNYPLGVHKHKGGVGYQAACRTHGRAQHLGTYQTPMLAHRAWQLAKYRAINESVMMYVCNDIYNLDVVNTLLGCADELMQDALDGIESKV